MTNDQDSPCNPADLAGLREAAEKRQTELRELVQDLRSAANFIAYERIGFASVMNRAADALEQLAS